VKRLLIPTAMLVALNGCGTDPSTVDLTGTWLIVAHSHAADLSEDQQSCTLRHGLIITSDSAATSIGSVRGLFAQGDTTGRFQCVLYGETQTPTPRFRGNFVVTRSGTHVGVHELNSGLLAYEGTLRNVFQMDGPVGIDVLGVGSWRGWRLTSD
jgi:hypothetical protein